MIKEDARRQRNSESEEVGPVSTLHAPTLNGRSHRSPINSFRIDGSPSAITTATQGVSGEVILPDHSGASTLPGLKSNSWCASGKVRFSVRMLKRCVLSPLALTRMRTAPSPDESLEISKSSV